MKDQTARFWLALCLAAWPLIAHATPYWDETQLEAARASGEYALTPQNIETGGRELPNRLDDIAYFVKYRQLCEFLTGLQYRLAGQNFGGMREGEVGSDFSIIQTDNTQEAIRVWSQYAIWTGDTARYAQNIRDAWTYCEEWPAWREEGGGYYAMHNCGWGFEAAAKYREAYGDTTWNWYADSCALWAVANPLALNSTLNYCASGLGIGGLYPHSVYRNRPDWQNHALNRARLIRNWFEASPARLNNALDWALCGGTALWGVCNSLWIAYPDSGADWINQYGTQLETWEAPSSWYNAFNTWYSNATFRCWEITGDSLYWYRGVFYADSLLGFDVDDDGGIPPGTCCIGNSNDHSWVSAYMGWMGLERIVSAGPIVDISASGFAEPNPALPYLSGDALRVTARVSNNGTEPVNGRVWVWGPNYSDSTNFVAEPGESALVTLPGAWTLPDVPDLPAQPTLYQRVRVIFENDTLWALDSTIFDIRRGGVISGTILGEWDTQTSPPCRIDFYSAAYPDSIWTTVNIGAGQDYSNGTRRLLSGENRMVITAPARYVLEERSFFPLPPEENPDPFDIFLSSTDVLLVDDDLDEDYETYALSSFEQNGDHVRLWNRQSAALADLRDVPWILWMTGDDSLTTLTAEDQTTLTNYLASGGGLFLTGQNITEDENTTTFLETVLRSSPGRGDTDRPRAYGLGGAPNVDGMFLLLLGSQGAGNQNSPSSILPLDNGTAFAINDTTDEEVCGIYGEYNGGRFAFVSFGIEAISGQAGSTSRAAFLDSVGAWLMQPTDASPLPPAVAREYELLPAFPNPFNGSVEIRWQAPQAASELRVRIFDVLGREVATLFEGRAMPGLNRALWDTRSSNGTEVSAGTYFVYLTAPGVSLTRPLRFIK